MNRLQKCLTLFFLCSVLSCSSSKTTEQNNPTLLLFEQQANALKRNWNSITKYVDLSYEKISSWIPESGIRGRYAQFKTKLSRQIVEKIIGHKAFIKGPHGQTLKFNSLTDFGHYNPIFLEQLIRKMNALYAKKTFVKTFQDFYDAELRDYLRVYYQAYNFIKYNEDLKGIYLEHIRTFKKHPKLAAQGLSPAFEMHNDFYIFANDMQDDGYDVYEGYSCPSFWLRRSIDGTSDQFYTLLTSTLNTFDPEFIY